MRKIIAGGMTALVATGVLLAGGGVAQAAPAEAATQQSGPARISTGYEYYTWYWTETNCENAGAALQVRGVISNFYCQQSGYTTWYLYVAYR